MTLEEAKSQMAFARQPRRIIEDYAGIVANRGEIGKDDLLVADDLERRDMFDGIEMRGDSGEASGRIPGGALVWPDEIANSLRMLGEEPGERRGGVELL